MLLQLGVGVLGGGTGLRFGSTARQTRTQEFELGPATWSPTDTSESSISFSRDDSPIQDLVRPRSDSVTSFTSAASSVLTQTTVVGSNVPFPNQQPINPHTPIQPQQRLLPEPPRIPRQPRIPGLFNQQRDPPPPVIIRRGMASGERVMVFWGDDNQQDPHEFIRSFERVLLGYSDAEKVSAFKTYLHSDSVADDWFTLLR